MCYDIEVWLPGQEKFRHLPAIWNDYASGYRSLPNTYIVRYEDLVTRPREIMMQVLAFLEEPWDEAVLEHERSSVVLPSTESSSAAVSQAVNTQAVDRWKPELSSEVISVIEQQAGPTLKQLGYAA